MLNLYGLTDEEIKKLSESQRIWYEEAGSAMINHGKIDKGKLHPLFNKILETFNGKEID